MGTKNAKAIKSSVTAELVVGSMVLIGALSMTASTVSALDNHQWSWVPTLGCVISGAGLTFVMYVATRLNAVYSLEKSNMGDGEEGQRMLEQHLTRIGPKIGGHQAAKVAAVASYEG